MNPRIHLLCVLMLMGCDDGDSVAATASGPAGNGASEGGTTGGATTVGDAATGRPPGDSGRTDATTDGPSGGDAGASTTGPAPSPSSNIIFSDDFESGSLSKWDGAPSRFAIETNPQNVRHGSGALRTTCAPGAIGSLEKRYMPGYSEVYLGFDMKFSSGFVNRRDDGPGMHMTFLRGNLTSDPYSAMGKAGQTPTGSDYFLASLDPGQGSNGALRPFVFYTYYPEQTSSPYPNSIRQTDPATPLLDDTWYHIVFYIKLNTVGQHDGQEALWIDGQQKIVFSNMRWRDVDSLLQNQLSIVHYMGDTGATGGFIYTDDVVVWAP